MKKASALRDKLVILAKGRLAAIAMRVEEILASKPIKGVTKSYSLIESRVNRHAR